LFRVALALIGLGSNAEILSDAKGHPNRALTACQPLIRVRSHSGTLQKPFKGTLAATLNGSD